MEMSRFSLIVDVDTAAASPTPDLVAVLQADRRVFGVTVRTPDGRPNALLVALTVDADSPEEAAEVGLDLVASALPDGLTGELSIAGGAVFGGGD